jgi:hypothetical protein
MAGPASGSDGLTSTAGTRPRWPCRSGRTRAPSPMFQRARRRLAEPRRADTPWYEPREPAVCLQSGDVRGPRPRVDPANQKPPHQQDRAQDVVVTTWAWRRGHGSTLGGSPAPGVTAVALARSGVRPVAGRPRPTWHPRLVLARAVHSSERAVPRARRKPRGGASACPMPARLGDVAALFGGDDPDPGVVAVRRRRGGSTRITSIGVESGTDGRPRAGCRRGNSSPARSGAR